jgi:hypothetical protein
MQKGGREAGEHVEVQVGVLGDLGRMLEARTNAVALTKKGQSLLHQLGTPTTIGHSIYPPRHTRTHT